MASPSDQQRQEQQLRDQPPRNPEHGARQAFLADYRRDLEQDRLRTLAEYQARHPGFEAAIAAEYALLEDEGEPAESMAADPPATPAGPHGNIAAGTRIASYVIERELGHGAQATVYLARDQQLGRQVALKLLTTGAGLDRGSEAFRRFQREAASTARLDHPGICTVYEAGEAGGVPFLAMRYVRGETLASRLARRRADADSPPAGTNAMSTGRELHPVLRIIEQCARALHAAHEHGLVHRDVKPGNIVIQEDGRPVLLDFGIAGLDGDDGALTRSGSRLGTPYYMAREQVLGQRVDRRTDVYALGVILYECLTLRRPFEAEAREALFASIVASRPRPARRLNPRVPRDLQVVLETAMDPEPRRRYATALALAEDLERLRRFEPIRARPIGLLLRARRWSQRHPVRSTALLLGTAALTATGVLWGRAERALDDGQEARDLLLEHGRLTKSYHGPWGEVVDRRRVAELLLAADQELWPVRAEAVPAMREWLAAADELLHRRDDFAGRLALLRGTAPPQAPGERDGTSGAQGAELHRLESARSALAAHLAAARGRPDGALERELAALDLAVQAARERTAAAQPRFPDADRHHRHGVLTELLEGLATLAARRADVALRCEAAASLRARSLEGEAAARWASAQAAIAAEPAYGGLRVEPQPGLLPLRADPRSGLWEFAHLPSGRPPAIGADGSYDLQPASGLVLVLIPGGTFPTGRAPADAAPGPVPGDDVPADPVPADEPPAHRVQLEPFLLSKYEMTRAQWARLFGGQGLDGPLPAGGVHGAPGAHEPLQPVRWVDHREAEEAMRRLGLALPTEAQWEFAARTGCGAADLAPARRHEGGPIPPGPLGIGAGEADALGLHDLAGNVREWCRDLHGSHALPVRPGDGLRAAWDLERAIVRGGSWCGAGGPARRHATARSHRDEATGVRPARALQR